MSRDPWTRQHTAGVCVMAFVGLGLPLAGSLVLDAYVSGYYLGVFGGLLLIYAETFLRP